MPSKQKFWPYNYCPRCKRISPIKYDLHDDKVCKVCDRVLFDDEGGRTILFDQKEAELRNLPFFGEEREENED